MSAKVLQFPCGGEFPHDCARCRAVRPGAFSYYHYPPPIFRVVRPTGADSEEDIARAEMIDAQLLRDDPYVVIPFGWQLVAEDPF